MTKDILLKIKGLQFLENSTETDESAAEAIEIITAARYFEKNGNHYIKYDEVLEGFDGTIKNLIKIGDDHLEVSKRGLTNINMIFEKNKKNMTYYDTPMGNLLVGISTTAINVNTEPNIIDIKVDYALEINYEHLADCSISMNIQSKNKEAQLF